MADFEDANSPTWDNVIDGQVNLHRRRSRGTIAFDNPDGQQLPPERARSATLLVRPRGWHLAEKHVLVDGEPISAQPLRLRPLLLPQRRALLARGSGPYFYLPKLESHLEARLWNDVFTAPQDALGIPRGTIRATVLIETILAAFEMDEILYELRDHSAGLNAGRWDYIFSVIKKFRNRRRLRAARPRPGDDDRALHARLHRAAGQDLPPARRPRHRRHGGLHPQPPRRRGQRAGARARCARTRSARPATASTAPGSPTPTSCRSRRRSSTRVLGERPNQKERQRDDVARRRPPTCSTSPSPAARSPRPACATTSASALQYLDAWLRGHRRRRRSTT